MSPTFFFVAGEASGDLHGARLLRALKEISPEAQFLGHGGDRMAQEGMEIKEHVNSLAIMGFAEVIKHLPYFRRLMRSTVALLEENRPDRVILIDYPGFNLRLAKKIHPLGIPITYFILPQVWAWKEKRVHLLRDYVDQALCIFPFEEQWFRERGVEAMFVGHPFAEYEPPIMDRDTFYQSHGLELTKPLIALFPGSRQQEVDRHWPIFLRAVTRLRNNGDDLQIIVGKAPHVMLTPLPATIHVEQDTPRLALQHATTALLASGTATLEAAVFDTPLVACYRLNPLSWFLVKHMAKVPYASMVNLIADEQVVPEYLQENMTPECLAKAVEPLLRDSPERNSMLAAFKNVRKALGEPGVYERTAKAILQRSEL
jgi:lipid-A-disaccharide synthase